MVPIQTRSYSTIKMLAKIFIASSLEVINAMQKLTLIFVNMMHPTTYQNIFTAAEALRSRGLVIAWCVFLFVFAICLLMKA